ncbi:hypothetical protein Nepgr_017626 [Nepenthes gracilis]|uniref:Uncharacterized protein n=1 Tax=Nepenthes gracilis TaxID=150966 RepID=A0AAD3SPQ1_NEPGR|nr:hypothetical protein Nepgr_017626 [Nepenthes gracilis]
MKSRGVNKLHRSVNDGHYRYLRPGALAQLRDFKLKKSQICLFQLTATAAAAATDAVGGGTASMSRSETVDSICMEDIPSFSVRTYWPRCPQRKKLAASTPIFSRSQS